MIGSPLSVLPIRKIMEAQIIFYSRNPSLKYQSAVASWYGTVVLR